MEIWIGTALLILLIGTWKCETELQKTGMAFQSLFKAFQEQKQAYQQEIEKKQAEITLSQELKNAQKKVERVVDTSSVSAEKIHQSLASLSFNFLKRLSPMKKPIEVAQNIHDQTAKELYGSLREVNQELGTLTNEILTDKKKAPNQGEHA